MPPNSKAHTGLEIDHTAHTIRFVRSFDAPAALVFEAWTRPEHVRCWWDPDGEPLTVCEIDLRPGGVFRFATRNHVDRPFTGVYQEIDPPHRLVFEALNSPGRVLLASLDGKTRLTVEIVCANAEHLAKFLEMGVAVGTAQTLDNLVAYIAREGVTA